MTEQASKFDQRRDLETEIRAATDAYWNSQLPDEKRAAWARLDALWMEEILAERKARPLTEQESQFATIDEFLAAGYTIAPPGRGAVQNAEITTLLNPAGKMVLVAIGKVTEGIPPDYKIPPEAFRAWDND